MAVELEIPNRCLLVQAAIYLSDGTLPIPDVAYLADPDENVVCPKDLIRALGGKAIAARGNLFEATRRLPSDTILDFEPFGYFGGPEVENSTFIIAELWSADRVDIAQSKLIGKNDDVKRLYGLTPLDRELVIEHCYSDDEKPMSGKAEFYEDEGLWGLETAFIFTDITVSTEDLFKLRKPPTGTSVEEKSKGGRPPTFKWYEFYQEIVVRADLDGLPVTQTELLSDMRKWFDGKGLDCPSDTVLKEKISPIYNHPRKKQP